MMSRLRQAKSMLVADPFGESQAQAIIRLISSVLYFHFFTKFSYFVDFRTRSLASLDPDAKLVTLRLNKWELDDAHKDKQNKIYASDFRVSTALYVYCMSFLKIYLNCFSLGT